MGFLDRILKKHELGEDEQLVADLLESGPVQQKELMEKTGFNSVKFNKVLRSLEEQGIAKREPRGRENVVRLV